MKCDTRWHYFGVLDKQSLKDFRRKYEGRFHDILAERSEWKPDRQTLYNVHVRGYSEIPEELSPGREFVPVGFLREGENASRKISGLKRVVEQGLAGRILVSVLVMPGPFFQLSPIAKGQYEIVDANRVIWMRWFDRERRS